MSHQASAEDQRFTRDFEACTLAAETFDHVAHVRLAYVYLCTQTPEAAYQQMKKSLRAFLNSLDADPNKFHETITRAWIDAVRYFMDSTPPCTSFARFIAQNPALRDARIMLSHYTADTLFSDAARRQFIAPDRQPIPPPIRE